MTEQEKTIQIPEPFTPGWRCGTREDSCEEETDIDLSQLEVKRGDTNERI